MKTFRLLDKTDAPVLAALHARLFDPPWSVDAFGSELIKTNCRAIACLGAGETIAGFILVQHAGDTADILTLATAPEHQRRGVARSLIDEISPQLTARGVTRLLLDVAADNGAALALYRQTGFTQTGRRQAYYRRAGGVRLDALLMEQDLTGLPATNGASIPHG